MSFVFPPSDLKDTHTHLFVVVKKYQQLNTLQYVVKGHIRNGILIGNKRRNLSYRLLSEKQSVWKCHTLNDLTTQCLKKAKPQRQWRDEHLAKGSELRAQSWDVGFLEQTVALHYAVHTCHLHACQNSKPSQSLDTGVNQWTLVKNNTSILANQS